MKSYELLDSGNGAKLERFGSRTLARPSSIALWQPRTDKQYTKEWDIADARYDVKTQTWKFHSKPFSNWVIELNQIKLELSLQNNGQIGFFPDHYGYMPEIDKATKKYKNPQVLNLFAYTGLASLYATQAGANVTHIDSARRCLDWTRKNYELNQLSTEKIKLIPEDALIFIKRAAKRNLKYQIIIADPPAFYRPDRNKIWHLEQNFHELLNGIINLLDKNGATLFFTSHTFSLPVLKNLLLDYTKQGLKITDSYDLLIPEHKSLRSLPAGAYAACNF